MGSIFIMAKRNSLLSEESEVIRMGRWVKKKIQTYMIANLEP